MEGHPNLVSLGNDPYEYIFCSFLLTLLTEIAKTVSSFNENVTLN